MSKQTFTWIWLLWAGLVLCGPSVAHAQDLDAHDNYVMSDEFIEKINSIQSGWKAGRNFDSKQISMNDIRMWCGARDDDSKLIEKLKVKSSAMDHRVVIPEEYDLRKVWPNCSSIGLIRDQGNCGSCWAFAVTGTISDRICIGSGGKQDIQISAEDMLSCCLECGDGCLGGWPLMAWNYYCDGGVSTGGLYRSDLGCKPYSIPNCEHHGTVGPYPPCTAETVPTPECKAQCTNPSYLTAYQQDKHHGYGSAQVFSTVEQIQLEIMERGSVSVSFDVFEDFPHYRSGVYWHVTGDRVGGHAVRLVGWGVDNGGTETPYWLVANSWNSHWGEQGFFRIRRGTNECRIEDHAIGALPDN